MERNLATHRDHLRWIDKQTAALSPSQLRNKISQRAKSRPRQERLTMAAIKNDGEPNATHERCHENLVQSVTRNLTIFLEVDGANRVIESAVTIAIRIFHLICYE